MWWAIVIVTPELNNNKVLTKGNPKISICWVPTGGHWYPKLIEEVKLKWK